ncbi:hypothetical protein [Pseudonocardia lacus]|uniref:hypothetical protein n=1 Tax=Pseudonocardia lacus TaxID=2835865 RepID=UPI001BDBF590|nr:hypothetical protein [Pseudonocardia lacus]
MDQVLGVVRLQLHNVRFGMVLPLACFGAVVLLNMAVLVVNRMSSDESPFTSVMLTLYLTVGLGYIQITTQTFRFVLGMGVTRRAFAVAVIVLAVLDAAGYGALLGVLRLVEWATDGWGLGLALFRLDELGSTANPLLHWLVYGAPIVVLAMVGALVGALYTRWATVGVYALVVAVLAVLGGAAVLVTLADGWSAVGAWLAAQPPLALSTGYPLALAVPLAAAGWLVLRRATP